MALSDLTFKFYNDANLTNAHTGVIIPLHYTDLSDNPQDFGPIYFGSAQAAGTRQLQATASPGVTNITITPTFILPEFAVATAYDVGDYVEPTTPNGYKYIVTVAGTSHASVEPTWPTIIGNTVTSGTVTFSCSSAVHPITEVKLATTEAGLPGATGGASLSAWGPTLTSGTANAVQLWIRITNTVTTVSDSSTFPELALYINEVQETII